METLFEIADLAIYLLALERTNEALAIAASVAVAVPTPPPGPPPPGYKGSGINYNIWSPARFSHALVVHLGSAAMPEQAAKSRAALLADSDMFLAQINNNPKHHSIVEGIPENIADARKLLTDAAEPQTMKWECMALSRAIGQMILYAERGAAGYPYYAANVSEVPALISLLLAKLGVKLRTAK